MKFYNRENEIILFNERLSRNGFELIVFSGRRRVGKTELIRHLDSIDLYFYITKETSFSILSQFEDKLRVYFNEDFIQFRDWNDFFKYLISKARISGLNIVFDEFQNFEFVDKSFFSIFQRYLEDISRDDLNLKFICTGSYINMIKNIFNSSASPLYGRKTAELILKPLKFKYCVEILKDLHHLKNNEDIINIYSLFSGIPRYYQLTEKEKSKNFNDILDKLLFSQISPLKSEVREVFFEDIINTKKEYLSILKAISKGNNTNSKIAEFSGIKQTSLPGYLDELENIYEVIERRVPITDDELKSKKGRYFLKDSFLLFWFRFIESNKSNYEFGNFEVIKENILNLYSDFVGKNTFENLAREYIQKNNKNFITGSWWSGSEEIDICAYDLNNNFIFGECKWTNKKVGFSLYNDLLKKIKIGKFSNVSKIYLFSKSGFEKNLIEKADELNIELIDLDLLVDTLVN